MKTPFPQTKNKVLSLCFLKQLSYNQHSIYKVLFFSKSSILKFLEYILYIKYSDNISCKVFCTVQPPQ